MGGRTEVTILPLTYLGSAEWFAHLADGNCVIDTGENYVKQTVRNRAEILTANGVAALTVPVNGYGRKIPVKDVRVDNSKRWRHTHWESMVSAYRSSPYFDHYEERFAPVYARGFDFLTDLNLELLDILTRALWPGGCPVKISENYVAPSPDDLDMRGKKAFRRAEGDFTGGCVEDRGVREYTQVFHDRMPFVPGLSAVDLLFCEGPSAADFLLRP